MIAGQGSHTLGLLPLCLSAALLASLALSGSSNPPVLPGWGSRSVLAHRPLIGGQLRLRGGDARDGRGGFGSYSGGGGGGSRFGNKKQRPIFTINVRHALPFSNHDVAGYRLLMSPSVGAIPWALAALVFAPCWLTISLE